MGHTVAYVGRDQIMPSSSQDMHFTYRVGQVILLNWNEWGKLIT